MLGIMQGRLSKSLSGKIQEFPAKTWKKEFELANLIGIKKIEWTLNYNEFRLNPIFNIKNFSEVSSLQNIYDIQIPSLTLNCFVEAPFYKLNELTGLESDITDLLWIVKNLKHTKITTLVLPVVTESGIFHGYHLSNLINYLKGIENDLAKAKIKIAIECEFDINFMSILLNELNPRIFGINFDMGNSAALGHNPEEELSVCRNRIFNVHIKDRLLFGHSVNLGEGAVDFGKVANLLAAQDYKGNMILEAARDFEKNEFELVSSYVEFCKKLGWVEELSVKK
jgi:hexulose-6-phosphate isomerase